MRVYIVSDIHYASPAEQARHDHEFKSISNPIKRRLLRWYRDYIWLRDPFHKNHLLDQFLEHTGDADLVVANGDYSCDSAFLGVSDPAACHSAKICLERLRQRFGDKFHAIFGDHELGKLSLIGNQGGLRLKSWKTAVHQLGLEPFWKIQLGDYFLVGVVSSLLALPIFEPEALDEEREDWRSLHAQHMAVIRDFFTALEPSRKVILFCHDPTALPFLWRDQEIRSKLGQIERTILGHLHSPLFLWKSRILSGMPPITFLGNSVRRFSSALHEARLWKDFNVTLCPSLAGIELLKDGGFLVMDLDPSGKKAVRIEKRRILRENKKAPPGEP
ncbi:MAG: metallophosphoesterase, partial [Limisphaerales bacterium]